MAQTAPGIFARKATGLVREGNSSSVSSSLQLSP